MRSAPCLTMPLDKTRGRRAALALAILALAWVPARAQQRDSTARPPAAVALPAPGSALVPPITPKRAFLYSALLPGLGQSRLKRQRAAVGMLAVEALSYVMVHQSAADVRQARRGTMDSLVVSWVDGVGQPLGAVTRDRPHFSDADVRSRRAHVEDWIALILANHLLSGADAFVAAHLWDVTAHVGGSDQPIARSASIGFRIPW
jgi:hypothetical protein